VNQATCMCESSKTSFRLGIGPKLRKLHVPACCIQRPFECNACDRYKEVPVYCNKLMTIQMQCAHDDSFVLLLSVHEIVLVRVLLKIDCNFACVIN